MKSRFPVLLHGIPLLITWFLVITNAYASPIINNDPIGDYSIKKTVSTTKVAQKNHLAGEIKPTPINKHTPDVSSPLYVEINEKKPRSSPFSKESFRDIAEIIAAFASLGALLFLLWQNILLQRQTKELSQRVRSSTYQNIVNHYVDINKTLAIDSGIAEAYDSFGDSKIIFSQEKERKREWLAWWLLNHYENAYMQFQLGVLPKYMWNGIENDCVSQIKKPYISNLWESSKQLFSDEFRDFIEIHAQKEAFISEPEISEKTKIESES